MGFHFLRYVNAGGTVEYLPSMHGSGDNEVILYPNQMISIVMAKASAEVLGAEKTRSDEGPVTIRAVERLAPFCYARHRFAPARLGLTTPCDSVRIVLKALR